MDKQKNVRRDITNSCADNMLNRITECFNDSLKGIGDNTISFSKINNKSVVNYYNKGDKDND